MIILQPLKLGENIYNYRKLEELPYHLLHASKKEITTTFKKEVLANCEWLQTKIAAFSINGLTFMHCH